MEEPLIEANRKSLPVFPDEARQFIRERAQEVAAKIEQFELRPLPKVRSIDRRYTPEGERIERGAMRLLDQPGLDSDEARTEYLKSVVQSGKPLDKLFPPPQTPLERAQEMVYEAQNANGRKRVKLARRALSLCPDCSEAYLLLCEDEDDQTAARALNEQAIEAAARTIQSTLGEEFWAARQGFWTLPARPYLRARAALAEQRWNAGEDEAALSDFRELLELDSDDHLGVRYQLMVALLELRRDEEAAALLDEWDDDSAHWTYTRALLNFRRTGRMNNADLEAAFAANPMIALVLVGLHPLRKPREWGPRTDGEALEYITGNLRFWVGMPAALEALAERLMHDLQKIERDVQKEKEVSS